MKQIKTWTLAFTYVGCFLGAGFISGQELWQFFGAFGNWGYVGFALATLLFVVIGVLFIRLTQMTRCSDMDQLLVPWDIKWLRAASGAIGAVFLFFVVVSMSAGVGAMLTQLFGVPTWLGSAVFMLPDAVSSSYLYCVPGSDLTESGTYSTAAVRPVGYYTDIHGAERVKTGMPWQSMAASLAELLTASNAGNTVRVEAQYTGGGYTAYQWFDMTVVRTPTLAALEVTVQGVAQSIGFAPERETYELSVTADKLVITPTAFASGYTVTVNGQETPSGTAVTMPVNAEGAEITVAVSSGGRSRTYTLAVQRVAAVDVTVRHDSDVTVHVFNSAHAEIGAAEQGSGFDRFALVPGESYTYVTDKQTWYHAAGGFTAAEGLTVDAQTPDTADALDSLYLATKGTKIQSNDQVCLAVPADAKHAYAFSLADYSSSLYCWAKAEGYTFTAVETGNTIKPKAATATGQHLTNFLKTGDAQRLGVGRIQRVLGVHKGHLAAHFLRLRQHMQRQRRLTGGFRPVDLHDTAAGQATDTQRQIQRQGAGGDGLHVHRALRAVAHDGALAVHLLDLLHGRLQRLFLVRHHRCRGNRFLLRRHNSVLLS